MNIIVADIKDAGTSRDKKKFIFNFNLFSS